MVRDTGPEIWGGMVMKRNRISLDDKSMQNTQAAWKRDSFEIEMAWPIPQVPPIWAKAIDGTPLLSPLTDGKLTTYEFPGVAFLHKWSDCSHFGVRATFTVYPEALAQ